MAARAPIEDKQRNEMTRFFRYGLWSVISLPPSIQLSVQGSSLDKSSVELLEIAATLQDPQGAKPVGEASNRVKVGVIF